MPWPAERFDPVVFAAMAPLVQTRVGTLAEVPGMVDFMFLAEPEIDHAARTKALGAAGAHQVLAETTAAYAALESWDASSLKAALEEVGTAHGLKLGKAQAGVRVAVTGRSVGPPLFEALELLGRNETLRRLRALVPAPS